MTTPDHYAHEVETVAKQEAVLKCLEGHLSTSECHFIATAIKYVDRMGEKAGEPLEKDAFKAANYLHRAIKGSWIDERS